MTGHMRLLISLLLISETDPSVKMWEQYTRQQDRMELNELIQK